MIPPQPNRSVGAWCLATSLVLCALEGAARKWLFFNSGAFAQGIFYFAKDVPLAIGAVYSFTAPLKSALMLTFRHYLIIATCVIGLAALANIQDAVPVGGVVTVRSLLFLPWSALLIAPSLRGRYDVQFVCNTVGVLALANAIIGGLQFALPPGHVLNQQVQSSTEAVVDLGRVRVSGTFSYISGMADLCIVACWAGALLILQRPFGPSGYICVAAGLLSAGYALSRFGLTSGAFILGMSILSTRAGKRTVLVLGTMGVIGLLLFQGAQSMLEDADLGAISTVYERHRQADSFAERLMSTYLQIPQALEETPLGTGLGMAQAAQQAATVGERGLGTHETELARVVFELGVVGLTGVLIMRISVLATLYWHGHGSLRRLPETMTPTRVTTFWAAFCILLLLNTCFDHVLGTFAWIIVTTGMAEIERQARVAVPAPRRQLPVAR